MSPLHELSLPIHLDHELWLLCRQGLRLLLEIVTSPLVFGSRDDALQIGFCPAFKRLRATPLAVASGVFAGLECLRAPRAPMCARQGVGHPLGRGAAVTHVWPDTGIELVGRAVPRRTALLRLRVEGLGRTATDIIAMSRWRRPCHAGGLAHATTAQRPEAGGLGRVVSRGSRRVEGQLSLTALTILLTHPRRDGGDQGPPRGRRGILTGGGFPQGLRGRAPEPCRPRLGPADVECSRLGGVRQEPMEGRGAPAPIPARSLEAKPEERRGQTEQGPVRCQIAGKDLRDDGAFGRLARHARRITRPVWRPARAIGRDGPGQKNPGLELPLASPSPPFGHECAFICGHGPANVQEQRRLGGLTHRLIEALDTASHASAFLPPQHLMDIVACQTIRTRDDDPGERPLLPLVTSAVKPRSVQRGTTIPIVAEDLLGTQGLAWGMDVREEALDLLCNGLGQRLPGGRYPAIDRDAQASPPPVVRERGRARWTARSVSSRAAGLGTPDPIAAPRPPLAGMAAVSARGVSGLPSR